MNKGLLAVWVASLAIYLFGGVAESNILSFTGGAMIFLISGLGAYKLGKKLRLSIWILPMYLVIIPLMVALGEDSIPFVANAIILVMSLVGIEAIKKR